MAPSQNIGVATSEQKTAIVKIEDSNQEIGQSSKTIAATVPENVAVVTETQKIDESLKKSTDAIKDLKESNEKITQANAIVLSLENEVAKLKAEKETLKDDAIKKIYSNLSIWFGLGFTTIIAGAIVGFFVDRKLGLMIAGIGVLGLALAAGAVFYLKAIAYIGIAIIIGSIVIALGIGLWSLVKETKEKTVLAQANAENVTLVEEIKNNMPEDLKEKVFGQNKKGLVHQIQSKSTQEVVKKIKEKDKAL